jgi:atypical dual specificity phosphatase
VGFFVVMRAAVISLAQVGGRGAGADYSMVTALARVFGTGLWRRGGEALLSLRGFGIAYGERRIVDSIELDIHARRVLVVMGPAGTGKSSLLRSLCCEPVNSMRLFGEAKFRGRPLDAGNRPVLVEQQLHDYLSNVHEYLAGGLVNRSQFTREEQRRQFTLALRRAGLPHLVAALDQRLEDLTALDRKCLSLVRALARDPPLVCLDEVTAGVADPEPLLSLIREERARRAFLVVTHHQGHARELADEVVLLAGGRIVEQSPSATFFLNPQTGIAARFLKTGGCDLPSLDARPEHLAPEYRPQADLPAPVKPARHNGQGPPGFRWLIEGRLAGTRQPGIFGGVERELVALRDAGATMLVSLTAQPLEALDAVERIGLKYRWLPIEDMGVPGMADAVELCAAMEREIESGGAVVYHCLAGHGRTGLMLAVHLIYRGMAAAQALEHARQRKREWVQSVKQEQFLWDLELSLALSDGRESAGNRSAGQESASKHRRKDDIDPSRETGD